jgi:hypothetical protein
MLSSSTNKFVSVRKIKNSSGYVIYANYTWTPMLFNNCSLVSQPMSVWINCQLLATSSFPHRAWIIQINTLTILLLVWMLRVWRCNLNEPPLIVAGDNLIIRGRQVLRVSEISSVRIFFNVPNSGMYWIYAIPTAAETV